MLLKKKRILIEVSLEVMHLTDWLQIVTLNMIISNNEWAWILLFIPAKRCCFWVSLISIHLLNSRVYMDMFTLSSHAKHIAIGANCQMYWDRIRNTMLNKSTTPSSAVFLSMILWVPVPLPVWASQRAVAGRPSILSHTEARPGPWMLLFNPQHLIKTLRCCSQMPSLACSHGNLENRGEAFWSEV